MAIVQLFSAHPIRALDANGDPVSGALLTVYDAGTTNSVTTYTDTDGLTANPSPVVGNSSGSGFTSIYVEEGVYKIDVTDSLGASLPNFPIDDVRVDSSGVFSSSSAPPAPVAHQIWVDTSPSGYSNVNRRNGDNDAWVLTGIIDESTDTFYSAGIEMSRSTLTSSGSVNPPTGAATYDRNGCGGGGGGAGCENNHSGSGRADAALGGNAGSEGSKRGLSLSGVNSITVTIGAAGSGGSNTTGTDGGDTTISDGQNTDSVFSGGKAPTFPATSTTPKMEVATTRNDACTFVDIEKSGDVSSPAFHNGGDSSGTGGHAAGGRGGGTSRGIGGNPAFREGISGTSAQDGGNASGLGAGGGGSVRLSVGGTSSGNAIGGDGTGGWAELVFYAPT